MKKFVRSADIILSSSDGSFSSLEDYVNLPFDLNNYDVQYKIAEWAYKKIIHTLKNTRGYKRRKFFVDDLSWSSSKIYFQVIEELKTGEYPDWPSWDFNCRLNFYDGDSKSYEDIEYLIDLEINEFIHYL